MTDRHDATFTAEMLKAARALAGLGRSELAAESRVSLETIKRIERMSGSVKANRRTLSAISEALAARGVAFHYEAGRRMCVCRTTPGVDRTAKIHPSRAVPNDLGRLIYVSRYRDVPSLTIDAVLEQIARASVPRNQRLELTGALLYRNGSFLQILEGARPALVEVYGAIALDSRHDQIELLEFGPAEGRQFSDWLLCAHEWSASTEAAEVANLGMLSASDAVALMIKLRGVADKDAP